MRLIIFIKFAIFILLLVPHFAWAQKEEKPAIANVTDTSAENFNKMVISTEVRVRSEYRDGYRSLPGEHTTSAFFINQRSRLNFDYKRKDFDLFLSLQDTRVWGQQDRRTPMIPVYLFEAYVEPHITRDISVRIGRQRIQYDNERLFAENDWRLTGASHDAARIMYKKERFATEVLGAFNQSEERLFSTNYTPAGFSNYKVLLVHYLHWKISGKFIATTINAADGYESSVSGNDKTHSRYTSGGRLEYKSDKWYATFSGYYQYGKDSSGLNLQAYYLQPELKFSGLKKITIRLGMEYISGSNGVTTSVDRNFVPLYGVAHRFMGNMDFFTTFPLDVNNAGLVNPYLFLHYQKNNLLVRIENHLFYSQNNFLFQNAPINKYLGFENDWRINYKANNFTEIEFGFCWARVTKSMTIIKNGGDPSKTPFWSYLSLKFTPVVGKLSF